MVVKLDDYVDSRIQMVKSLISKIEEKLEQFPEGRINIRKVNSGTYYYFMGTDLKEKCLSNNDSQLIEDLLQKNYFERLVKISRQELVRLDRIKKLLPDCIAEDIYDQLTPDRQKWVKPIIPTDEQFVAEWQNRPFTPKPFKKGTPYFETLKGERVRSKSEVIIADRLYTSGIPYKYECPLVIGNEVIHPDFTILRVSDRKILYLEHNGMVGDQEYGDDMVDRINKYSLAGIMQNDKLYFTFESANRPLDVRTLDKLIEEVIR